MTGIVLVVEDDALVREALGQTLELEGYAPILAGSFIVAKDHIARDFQGVILSDIRMPGRDGLYLLNYVQSIDKDLPVVLDLSRFDAAPLIAFTATKEIDYGTETDGRIPPRCGAYRTDQRANAQAGG